LSDNGVRNDALRNDPTRLRKAFLADVHFPLDPFQREAFEVL
jgi:hypothetical protein